MSMLSLCKCFSVPIICWRHEWDYVSLITVYVAKVIIF